MKNLPHLWATYVVRYRYLVLTFWAIAIALAPLSFDRLYHDDSNESYFLQNDPNLQAYNRLLEEFGDNEYLLVGIPARSGDEDVFHPQTISVVAELTEFLENHRHVTQVRSLSKYQFTHDDDGMLATDDLFSQPQSPSENASQTAQARRIMAGEDLALGTLLTGDFQHTQIAARTVYRGGENEHKVEVVTELRDFIAEQRYAELGFDIHLSGVPLIGERFQTLTQGDMAFINPLMGLVMVTILLLIFRSLSSTLLPLVVIGAVVLLTTGLQGWLRWPFTAVNSALIPTMIILSVSTALHILVEFYQFRRKGLSPSESSIHTTRDLLYPVFFTCLTTAVGFVTLSVTELSPVRQFALLAASSAMIIFLLCMSALPALLSFIPWVSRTSRPSRRSMLTKLIDRVPDFVYRHKLLLTCTGAVITVFSIYSTRYITVDTNIMNYFKENSTINQDLRYFNQHFKGISNLEVIVDSGQEDGVKDPEFLQRTQSLQSYLEAQPETGKAVSLLRFYKQINQSINEDQTSHYTLPDSSAAAAQLLFLYENTGPEEDLSDLKSFDGQLLRISIPVMNMDARETTALLDRLRNHIDQQFSDLSLELTGVLVMTNAQNNYVNKGMFKSFGIAIAVIGISFLFLFTSFRYGVIALIPSMVPVILTAGLISLAGIAMDLGTMIVGAMTIGIAVDDSIHLMSRYRLCRKRGASPMDAVRTALATSGKAVFLTSCVLICGFSMMLLGSFVSYIYVGLFSAMIMILALLGNLVFMPALLLLFDRQPASPLIVSEPTQSKEVSHA